MVEKYRFDVFYIGAYPFEGVFILGQDHLIDLLRHWNSATWLRFFMGYRDDDALDSIFSPYLVWFRYSLTFFSYQNTPPLLPSHLYLVFNPPISFHHDMNINLFCFQIITGCRPITSSLVKLSCAFWILNLTSSMMTRLNILSIFRDVFHLIAYMSWHHWLLPKSTIL